MGRIRRYWGREIAENLCLGFGCWGKGILQRSLAILRLQQAEAESIVRHLRQIKMHSKEGRIIRDKMAGSFEKISNIMTVGITVKPEDIPAFSTMAENMKTASRETLAVMREYAELAEKHGVANNK